MEKIKNSFWIPSRDFTKFTQICVRYNISAKNAVLKGELPKYIHGFWCYDDEAYTIFNLLNMKVAK